PGRTAAVRERLRKHGMRCVIETGARFLLDPRRKHQPTLLSSAEGQRGMRLEWLRADVILGARGLEAEAVSFWSGAADSAESDEVLFDRLVAGCKELCAHAAEKNLRLAFEPEPGMFIDTMEKFERLFRAVAHPAFGLTLDIGHLQCMGEVPM